MLPGRDVGRSHKESVSTFCYNALGLAYISSGQKSIFIKGVFFCVKNYTHTVERI